MTGTLFIIGTPIGNLSDVTFRLLETFSSLDVLFCEDTRVTARLLARYELSVPLNSYREDSHEQKSKQVITLLSEGKNIGLVSDAGTPGVSDPGSRLVRDVVLVIPEVRIVPIPGPSAVTTALSVSGFSGDRFTFFGFPPHKKGRATFFKEIMLTSHAVVLYESPHRIFKTLSAIEELDAIRELCVCRELTKMHETIYRGTATEVISDLKKTSAKGEFVIVLGPMVK